MAKRNVFEYPWGSTVYYDGPQLTGADGGTRIRPGDALTYFYTEVTTQGGKEFKSVWARPQHPERPLDDRGRWWKSEWIKVEPGVREDSDYPKAGRFALIEDVTDGTDGPLKRHVFVLVLRKKSPGFWEVLFPMPGRRNIPEDTIRRTIADTQFVPVPFVFQDAMDDPEEFAEQWA